MNQPIAFATVLSQATSSAGKSASGGVSRSVKSAKGRAASRSSASVDRSAYASAYSRHSSRNSPAHDMDADYQRPYRLTFRYAIGGGAAPCDNLQGEIGDKWGFTILGALPATSDKLTFAASGRMEEGDRDGSAKSEKGYGRTASRDRGHSATRSGKADDDDRGHSSTRSGKADDREQGRSTAMGSGRHRRAADKSAFHHSTDDAGLVKVVTSVVGGSPLISLVGADEGALPSTISVTAADELGMVLGEVMLDTSCSVALQPGDTFGFLLVTSIEFGPEPNGGPGQCSARGGAAATDADACTAVPVAVSQEEETKPTTLITTTAAAIIPSGTTAETTIQPRPVGQDSFGTTADPFHEQLEPGQCIATFFDEGQGSAECHGEAVDSVNLTMSVGFTSHHCTVHHVAGPGGTDIYAVIQPVCKDDALSSQRFTLCSYYPANASHPDLRCRDECCRYINEVVGADFSAFASCVEYEIGGCGVFTGIIRDANTSAKTITQFAVELTGCEGNIPSAPTCRNFRNPNHQKKLSGTYFGDDGSEYSTSRASLVFAIGAFGAGLILIAGALSWRRRRTKLALEARGSSSAKPVPNDATPTTPLLSAGYTADRPSNAPACPSKRLMMKLRRSYVLPVEDPDPAQSVPKQSGKRSGQGAPQRKEGDDDVQLQSMHRRVPVGCDHIQEKAKVMAKSPRRLFTDRSPLEESLEAF